MGFFILKLNYYFLIVKNNCTIFMKCLVTHVFKDIKQMICGLWKKSFVLGQKQMSQYQYGALYMYENKLHFCIKVEFKVTVN